MQVSVTYKNIDSLDTLKDYAQKKLDKLDKLFLKPAIARVVFSKEKNSYIVDIDVTGGKMDARATEKSDSMNSSIDLAVDKLKLQLKKTRDKVMARRGKGARNESEMLTE